MTKKTQSIDGFILKRRESAAPVVEQRAFLDSAPSPKQAAPTMRRTEEILPDDIEASLRNLENEPDQLPPPSHELRRARKAKNRLPKKPHKIRRIIKWFFITVATLLLILVGWLAFKALMTGGKIFLGNPLDILTSKTRLTEDKNGRTNVLIFGTSGYSMKENAWDGALLTDSIMVLSVDQDKHDAYMISLPRDLWVKHTCKKLLGTSAGKLNETYYCAYIDSGENEDKGAAALRETAGKITGLDIQYYVHADWTALVQSVNAVGGVDVPIDSPDKRGIYDYMTGLKLPNGVAHLDGEGALALARARNSHGGYGLGGGNFDREMYQQKVLTALQQKAMSAGTLANPAAVNSLLDALGDNLRTNFKTSEVQTLLDLAKNVKTDNMISLPLVSRENGEPDLVTTGMQGSISIVRPVKELYDYSDIISYIRRNISTDPLTRENAKIDVLNGSEQSGLAHERAEKLKEDGYQIGKVTNAPASVQDKIIIYQLNDNKPSTAAALEKRFSVKVVGGKLDGYDTKADFVIVLGKNAVEN